VKLWIDAQLSPALVRWIREHFKGIEALAVRELGLRDAEDAGIFAAARQANAVVMSKDSDFVDLVNRLGPPPQVLWIRCGNTSNVQMRAILSRTLLAAVDLLQQGERLVEISGP
jgi:predicted nuclease of predicted toxin-antitoxin system